MYHIVHSIIIYNAAMNLSVHQQMNGKEYIYNILEYYSIVKRKETLSFMTTWIDPEGTMLNEMSAKD